MESNNSGLIGKFWCARSGQQAEKERSHLSFDSCNNSNHHAKADGTERGDAASLSLDGHLKKLAFQQGQKPDFHGRGRLD